MRGGYWRASLPAQSGLSECLTSDRQLRWGRAWTFCGTVLVIVALGSCGPSQRSTAGATIPPVAFAQSEIAVPPQADSSDAAALFSVTDKNLLANASFEHKDDIGRPRGWGVSPASIIEVTPAEEYDAYDGATTMTLRSTSESWGILFQDIRLTEDVRGKLLLVTAQGRSPLKNYMRLSVTYKIDGTEKEASAAWPESPDSWTSEAVRVEIPPGIDDSTVRVRVVIRNKPGFVFRVDDLCAVLM